MLWRAGSGYRQLFLLSFRTSQPKWFSTPPPPENIPSSIPKRDQEPEFRFTGRVPRALLSRFPLDTSAFLASIEELSRVNAPRDMILTRLQGLPSEVLANSKGACRIAQEMVDKSCPERAIHILHIAYQLGTVLTHSQYEQVVHRLATNGHWKHVHSVAAIARDYTGRWSVRLLNWTLRSHLETQQYGLLAMVLDTFEYCQLRPTRRTYQLLVQGHLQNSDLVRARECLLRMQADGFEMDKSTFLTVLGAYRTLGPNQGIEAQAFQALHGIGERSDTFILNGLMQLRIDDGDIAGALRVLDLFALPPFSDGGNGQEIRSQESEPSDPSPTASPNTPPDNATFNILLSYLAQRKDGLPSVLRVFRQMRLAGLKADAGSAAALIRAFATAKMTNAAVAIVVEMCKCHKLPIDFELFRPLGFPGDVVEADVLEALSVRPTTHVFNALLQAVLPEYELDGMRTVLQIMRQALVIPDASTTQIIVYYLDNTLHMRPRSLLRVLQTFAAFPTEQASLTVQHVNTVLRSILHREHDISRTSSWSATAQRLRFGHQSRYSPEQLSRKSPSFDPTAGLALASASQSIGELFEPIVHSLSDRQVMSDRMTFALRIRHDAVTMHDIKSAEHVFDAMVARGIRPNAYHFSALIEGYVEQGDMDAARNILDRAFRAGVKPNVVMYTILIIGYGKLGRPDLAKRTFSEMVIAGVQPDFAAVDAVVSAYWFVRAYGTARGLLLELWPLVARFPPELKEAPLRVLAQSLRTLRGDSESALKPIESPEEHQRRRHIGRKLGHTLQDLKQWQQVLEAVSWAKGDMGLNHLSHMYKKAPGGEEDQ